MTQLYLLTNEDPLDTLLSKLDKVLATGIIGLLQIRRKCTPIEQLPFEIEQILTIANRYHTTVIINDNTMLAKQFGLGVHLGQSDGSIATARQILGNQIIGRTCHTSLDLICEAVTDGADYVAIGAIFPSTTKPNASPVLFSQADLKHLQQLNKTISLCVIGGITTTNLTNIHTKLPNIQPKFIAVSHDILGKSINNIEAHCQVWQQTLTEFVAH